MSSANIGLKQNNINGLPNLRGTQYENIFSVNLLKANDNTKFYFYNILNSVIIPDSLDKNIFETEFLDRDIPWTTYSYLKYGTIDLWWLVFLINKPDFIFYAKSGQEIKFIKPEYVDAVISQIK